METCFNVYMSNAKRPARPDLGYASAGGVRQDGGSLRIARCPHCTARIVWPTSRRTGRRYPVNVARGYRDQQFYRGNDIHRCAPGRRPGTIPYAWATTAHPDGAAILIGWLRYGITHQAVASSHPVR